MKMVSKGRLKARMLEYFREVEATGEPLIVTDHGREVLEVRPVKPRLGTVAELLAEYRSGPGSGILAGEKELLRPEAVDNWEALGEERQAW